MRNLMLITLLAFASLTIGASAMADNGPGHGCYVEKYATPPGGGFTTWEYIYYIENNSTNHTITSWTWSYGGQTGNVMPTPHADTDVSGFDWPLAPSAGPDSEDTTYREEIFDDPAGPLNATSTVHFEDGFQVPFDIVIPSSFIAVPEPSSVMAIASGFLGLIGLIRRRRA